MSVMPRLACSSIALTQQKANGRHRAGVAEAEIHVAMAVLIVEVRALRFATTGGKAPATSPSSSSDAESSDFLPDRKWLSTSGVRYEALLFGCMRTVGGRGRWWS